jgi:predicted nucleotide-binding protein
MLNKTCFALLVMTAEDAHDDGKTHARENVVHEIGLVQGRLGFRKSIIVRQNGTAEFSNIICRVRRKGTNRRNRRARIAAVH